MNNEIKNILKCLEMDMLDNKQIDKLLDYITNLQEENEKVHKDFAELSERYFFTKSRNEKIINKISLYRMDDITMETNRILDDLLNTARGVDKE